MTRIILVGPPSAQSVLGTALRLSFIKVIAVLILDAILRYVAENFQFFTKEHPVIAFFNNTIYPLAYYPLWLGGIDLAPGQDSILTGVGCLLLFAMIWPASQIARYCSLKIDEYNEQLKASGSLGTARHSGWYLAAIILAGLVLAWRFGGDPASMDLPNHFYYLLRFAFTILAGTAAFGCLYVAFSLHGYWRSTNPKLPKPAKVKKPKLHVVRETVKPEAPRPASAQRALLVALTAELIQFCGRENRLPKAEELAQRLGPLLRAAQITGAGVPSPGELESICQQTLSLLDKGKLKPLGNLKEARKLYHKPGSSIDKIVGQLELHLKT